MDDSSRAPQSATPDPEPTPGRIIKMVQAVMPDTGDKLAAAAYPRAAWVFAVVCLICWGLLVPVMLVELAWTRVKAGPS